MPWLLYFLRFFCMQLQKCIQALLRRRGGSAEKKGKGIYLKDTEASRRNRKGWLTKTWVGKELILLYGPNHRSSKHLVLECDHLLDLALMTTSLHSLVHVSVSDQSICCIHFGPSVSLQTDHKTQLQKNKELLNSHLEKYLDSCACFQLYILSFPAATTCFIFFLLSSCLWTTQALPCWMNIFILSKNSLHFLLLVDRKG